MLDLQLEKDGVSFATKKYATESPGGENVIGKGPVSEAWGRVGQICHIYSVLVQNSKWRHWCT